MLDILCRVLLIAGYMLLPFSTSPESGGVLSFGLPFLALYAFLSLLMMLHSGKLDLSLAIGLGAFFLAAMWVSLPYSRHGITPPLIRLLTNLLGFTVFLSAFFFIQRARYSLQMFEKAVALCGTTLAIYYGVNLLQKIWTFGVGSVMVERYTGGLSSLPWGASNNISSVLLVGLIAAQICMKREYRWQWLACTLAISAAIVSTLSRTGIVLMLMFYVSMLFAGNFARKKALGIALLLLVAIMGSLYYWDRQDPESLQLVTLNRISGNELSSGSGRLDIWKERLDYIDEHLLMPIGYYSSLYEYGSVSSHNFFLTVILEQGIIGFVATMLFLSVPLIWGMGSREQDRIRPIYVFGLMLIMLNLMVEDTNVTQQHTLVFWLYMACLYQQVGRRRRREDSLAQEGATTGDLRMRDKGLLQPTVGVLRRHV